MLTTRQITNAVAVLALGCACAGALAAAADDDAEFHLRVNGEWRNADGHSGPFGARLKLVGDELSGFIDAPGNAALDGMAVSGSAASHDLSISGTGDDASASIVGVLYGDEAAGSYGTAAGEEGTWEGTWYGTAPALPDAWPSDENRLEVVDAPAEPARLSQLALEALEAEQHARAIPNHTNDWATPSGMLAGVSNLISTIAGQFVSAVHAVVTVGTNVLVNNSSDNDYPQNSPEVAVDRVNDPNKIAVGATDYSLTASIGKAGYYFSTNGGTTFPTRGTVPGLTNYGRSGNASLSFDGNGRVFYAGSAFNGTNPNNAVFVASANNGSTSYNNAVTVASSANTSTIHDKPWIAVNKVNDYVFVCWTESSPGTPSSVIKLARSTNNGGSFSTLATVSDDTNSTGCSIDVDSDGDVNVVWIKNNNEIRYDQCTSHGTSCGTDISLSGGTFTPCNTVHLAAYENASSGYVNRDVTINSNPTIAVDNRSGGNDYRAIVWCGKTTSPSVDYDVYANYWTSANGWYGSRKVATTTQFEFMPSITIDDNHLMQLVFYRRNSGSPLLFNAYASLSGSGTFSTPVLLNDGGNLDATKNGTFGDPFIGDYIGIDGATNRHPVWMDSRRSVAAPNAPEKQQDVESAPVSGC
ncbi:MAG TPA: hypothetical protein VEB21_02660 [Terriglobales bacterium]|nr:hypothetical protein [Terriglobales bacterium]